MSIVTTQTVEETEQQFVHRTLEEFRKADSAPNWILGEAASDWTERYASGRTDADFAALFGVGRERITICRIVFEQLGDCYTCNTLTWSHHREALNWGDRDESLAWANDTGATVGEMRSWHRARNGEDITKPEGEPVQAPTQQASEPHEPLVEPIQNTPKPTGEVSQSAPPDSAPTGNSEADSAAPMSQSSPVDTTTKPHVSNNSGEYEWYTPREIVDLAREVMCGIDLDPASCETANAIVKTSEFYDQETNGLEQEWSGAVWLNPPYAAGLVGDFVEKLLIDVDGGAVEQACVLVNNATETRWFQALADKCNAICFPRKRIKFWNPGRELATGLQGQAVLYFGYRTTPFRDLFSGQGVTVSR